MKRLYAITIVLCVILTLSGCGGDGNSNDSSDEGFSLRNGIHFGDSFEQVKEKETIELNDLKTYAEFYSSDDEEADTESEENPETANLTVVSSKYGTIANIENSRVEYTFDSDHLTEMQYTLGKYDDISDSSSLEATLKDNFETVVGTLVEKYGEPLYLEEGEEFAFHTTLWDMYVVMEEFMEYGLGGSAIGFKEWLVEADDGSHIVIDASCFYNESAYNGSLKGTFQVEYDLIPEDEWNDAVGSAIEKQQNLDNDL